MRDLDTLTPRVPKTSSALVKAISIGDRASTMLSAGSSTRMTGCVAATGYLGVINALALLRLLPMSDRDKDAEILALRHQIMVLERQLGGERVRFDPTDRAWLAALLHPLPRAVGDASVRPVFVVVASLKSQLDVPVVGTMIMRTAARHTILALVPDVGLRAGAP